MKNILIAVLFFSLIHTNSLVAQGIEGTVFLDSNENGVKDLGESGIEGILVSDGLNVVRTNENGEYKLEGFEAFHFVMVHTNASYRTSNFYHSIQGVLRYI